MASTTREGSAPRVEVIPHEVLRFLAMQLVLQADDLLAYTSRALF